MIIIFKLLDENLVSQIIHLKGQQEINLNKIYSNLDIYLIGDLYDAFSKDLYYLEILDNCTGNTITYNVVNAYIDMNTLFSNFVTFKLELQNVEKKQTEIRIFEIFEVEPNRDTISIENPKYYIYCSNENKIHFRFWFKQKHR